MTTIAFGSPDPAAHVRLLRQVAKTANSGRNAGMLVRLADAIEAAADKRVIVLDVDGLGLDEGSADALRTARRQTAFPSADAVLSAAADALDSLPRPISEPTGLGAVVRDRKGECYVRFRPDGGPAKWALATTEPVQVATLWSSIDAVEVLSPGVDGGTS